MHQTGPVDKHLLHATSQYHHYHYSNGDVPGHLKLNVQNSTHPHPLHICSFLSFILITRIMIPSFPQDWNPEEITLFHCNIYSAITLYQWQSSNLPSLLHILWHWLNFGPQFSSECCNSSFLLVLFPPVCSPQGFQNYIFKIIIILLSFKTLYCDFYEEPSGFCSNMTNQTHVIISIPS